MMLSDGRELHQVKIVAAVRDVDYSSTTTSWTIEDGTGLLAVKVFNTDEVPAVSEMHQQVCYSSCDKVFVTRRMDVLGAMIALNIFLNT